MSWKIEITPTSLSGDGRISICEPADDGAWLAFIVRDGRRTVFFGDNRVELFRGILEYGALTKRLNTIAVHKWQRSPWLQALDSFVDRIQKPDEQDKQPTVADIMSGS